MEPQVGKIAKSLPSKILRRYGTYFIERHLIPLLPLRCGWVRKPDAGLLASLVKGDQIQPPRSDLSRKIEWRCDLTQRLGKLELWDGYPTAPLCEKQTRSSHEVRTHQREGNFYSWLVQLRRPDTIVEFGTAFGVSGMYWLAGIEHNRRGHLFTFEPNERWLAIARENLRAISDRFTAVHGTFEEAVDDTLKDRPIDIALIDAIHTSAFVLPQLDIVLARSRPGAIVILDDIEFSSDMRECWERIAKDSRVLASLSVGRRLGVIELA